MANYLRVRDASGRLIAHDGMKSMRFVSKHDIVVRHPVSNLSFMCSGEVPAAVSSNLIAVQSPRPVGLSFGEEPQGLGGEVHRLYSENHGSNKSNFTARVFCFARPSTTRQGGPGIRAYDSAGNISFNSADLGVRIVGVYSANMSRNSMINGGSGDLKVIQRINTGLPAGNYAVAVSPGYWTGDAARSTAGNPRTIMYRYCLTVHMSGTQIVVASAADYQRVFNYYVYNYYSQGASLPMTYTVFDVSDL